MVLRILREEDVRSEHKEMGCYNFCTILPIVVYHIKIDLHASVHHMWLTEAGMSFLSGLFIVLCGELIAGSGALYDSRE
jgi:hypothetical protein